MSSPVCNLDSQDAACNTEVNKNKGQNVQTALSKVSKSPGSDSSDSGSLSESVDSRCFDVTCCDSHMTKTSNLSVEGTGSETKFGGTDRSFDGLCRDLNRCKVDSLSDDRKRLLWRNAHNERAHWNDLRYFALTKNWKCDDISRCSVESIVQSM